MMAVITGLAHGGCLVSGMRPSLTVLCPILGPVNYPLPIIRLRVIVITDERHLVPTLYLLKGQVGPSYFRYRVKTCSYVHYKAQDSCHSRLKAHGGPSYT